MWLSMHVFFTCWTDDEHKAHHFCVCLCMKRYSVFLNSNSLLWENCFPHDSHNPLKDQAWCHWILPRGGQRWDNIYCVCCRKGQDKKQKTLHYKTAPSDVTLLCITRCCWLQVCESVLSFRCLLCAKLQTTLCLERESQRTEGGQSKKWKTKMLNSFSIIFIMCLGL